MDDSGIEDVGRYLRERWRHLGEAEAVFCQPWLEMDAVAAHQRLDPEGNLGPIADKDVLCLAGGGGQQSIAFNLLGARVTVLDLDPDQLARDRRAAAHFGFNVRLEEGDMRDLSRFSDHAFDIVWHPYSVNFVPEFEQIVEQVARVLRPGGVYTLMIANPFGSGIGTRDWNGAGYVLRLPYVERASYEFFDEEWVYGGEAPVPQPREFRHTLGKVVRVLADTGFLLFRLDEHLGKASSTETGTWEHLKSVIPPWFTLWARRVESP